MGTPVGLEGQIQALATGRLPTVGTLSPPPFPWHTPVAPVIQTLSIYRGFHVHGRRCLWHPFPCSVPPTFLVLLGGTPSHYPGDGVCHSYGQAACPHRPVFSAKSLVPGQLPPGSGGCIQFFRAVSSSCVFWWAFLSAVTCSLVSFSLV